MSFATRARKGVKKPARPKPITPERLERAALFYLGRYASSAEGLRRVLLRRLKRARLEPGEAAHRDAVAAIDRLVARFAANGLLDDRKYAEAQAASLHRRGIARRRIGQRLGVKGVARDDVEAALATLDLGAETHESDAVDLAAALALARRKRLGPHRPAAERKVMRARDLASLARAGFAYDVARRVIDARDLGELEAEIAGVERETKPR
ncbi:MAG TPA: RecX family transcriptional regulator [Alphaproteobacteria bacterium]|nr:RecX family transcriptional regulator [Alphaproteobacteria bacterium]